MSGRSGGAATRLHLARRFIDECFDQPLDLDVMAQRAGLSRFHFARAFHDEFGETPHRYLRRRRIERAKQLLAAGNLSVTDVCFEVGFESLGSFSALFHRLVGHPPARHRGYHLVAVSSAAWPRTPVFVPSCFLRMFGAGDRAA
jgi:AraC-like DNA-binding protein